MFGINMKKSRVSWPPDRMLCQVKLFWSEDCPAEVSSQPQNTNSVNVKQSSGKPDLPPGFERNHYATKPKLSGIPRIKWKRPPKLTLIDKWRVGAGDESTERHTENLRIARVLEAIYPHRSAIPSRPSVSPDVEGGHYDDSKTPIIRNTPIEDDWEAANESSKTSRESDSTVSRQNLLEPRPPGSAEEPPAPVSVSALGPDVSLAASAVLTALMKSKEQQSMIDPDLLVKFLSDPKIIQNLISDRTQKPSEAVNPPVDTNITPRRVPQPVPSSAVDRNPQPIPQKQTFAASQPFALPEPPRVSPPRSGNGNQHVGSYTSVAVEPPPLQPSQLAPNLNHTQRTPPAFGGFPVSTGAKPPQRSEPAFSSFSTQPIKVVSEPNQVMKSQPHPPCSSSLNMNAVQSSMGPGPGPGINTSYPMNNLNRVEVPGRPNPVKSVDYFKNLIREHGTDNPGVHEKPDQIKMHNGRVENNKKKKHCMYFGSARGCRLGDNCTFLHDPSRPKPKPKPKRPKFGS